MIKMGKLNVDYISSDLSVERAKKSKTIMALSLKYEKKDALFYSAIEKGQIFTILSRKPQIIFNKKFYLVIWESVLDGEKYLSVVNENEFGFC